jgi:hypothetical protein
MIWLNTSSATTNTFWGKEGKLEADDDDTTAN